MSEIQAGLIKLQACRPENDNTREANTFHVVVVILKIISKDNPKLDETGFFPQVTV